MKNLNEYKAKRLQYEYLDLIKRTGKINMLGAGVFLQNEFGLSKKDARKVLMNWIESF